MASLVHPQTSLRTVGWFALGGTLGPLLILALLQAEYGSLFYHHLYAFISAICPAWLLGQLEYSYGRAVTWTVIFVTNIVVWALLGVIVAIGRRARMGPIAFALVSALAISYAYWISQSALAILGLVLVLAVLFIASGDRLRAGNA